MNSKIKYIPAVMSLTAGFIASIIAIISKYDTLHIMIITLASLFGFYIAGLIVRFVCEKNFVIVMEEQSEEDEAAEDDENKEAVEEGEQPLEGSLGENKQ